MNDQRIAELMTLVTDGLATEAERSELLRHVEANPDLRDELDAHLRIKAISDQWVERLNLDRKLPREGEKRTVEQANVIFIHLNSKKVTTCTVHGS